MFKTLTILSTFSSFFTPLRASTVFPTLELSNFDGVIGSVLNGVSDDDQSGISVASAGDFNGDGFKDLIVGAWRASPGGRASAGSSFVIFGTGTGINAALDLSILNGSNGFRINGVAAGDNTGRSVASAGDFNGDGFNDLIIGASEASPVTGSRAGSSFVVFGTNKNVSATLELSTLNGANGFRMNGLLSPDRFGSAVASAGDFNNDGLSDVIIGAVVASPGGRANAGSSFVVFGTNKSVAGTLDLSLLNGTNGFRINGVLALDGSGISVASAGDINRDGLGDVVIGAADASPGNRDSAGSSFVVFGTNKSVGPTLELSTLNGTNGFSINGVSKNDNSGISVANAGDINRDGFSDLIIGASDASPGGRGSVGSSFVIFGTNRSFPTTLELSALNGVNGFRINGVSAGDNSGISVASAGDINGDGINDIIIGAKAAAPGGLRSAGSSFVVFGTNKSFPATLQLSALSSTNGFRINGVSADDNSGVSVASAGDINGDGLSDIMIGATGASPGNSFQAGSSYLLVGDSIQPINNQLTILAGGEHILTPSDLNFSVPHNPGYTQYTISELRHGQFEYTDQPGIAINSFSAQNVMIGRVKFIHDDSELPPSYSIIAKHTFAIATANPANITFINELPRLVNNSLIIDQGKTIKLGSFNLAAVNPDNPQRNSEIIFNILDSSNGFPSTFSFPQSQLLNGGVYFTHDNTINTPEYRVSISLGGVTIGPVSTVVDFDTTPVLDQNHFDTCQGQTQILTSNMLSAIHPGANSSDPLIFSINNLQYGRFERKNAPGIEILAFSQAEVKNSSIQFVHDGSANPPSFRFTISDNRITTSSDFAGIYFSYAPILKINTLALNQGQTVVLNDNMLDAINPNLNALSEDLKFKVSNVKGGAFIRVNTTQNITQFNQSQVTANEIAFRSDATPNAPSYSVSVENQCSQTSAAVADVNFNSAPSITANQLTVTGAQPVILTPAELSATDQETSLGNLVFTASGVKNGCFDTTILPGTCITVFSQQRLFNGEIRFVPENNLLPAYNMSVRDDVLSSTDRPASITLASLTNTDSVLTDPTNYTGAVVGSVIGLGAIVAATLGFSWYRKKKENDRFKKMLLEEGTSEADKIFKQEVIYPIANKIFNAINTTGCLRQRTEADNNAYMIAITKIVSELQGKNANLALNTGMKPGEKEAFLNEIARQTRQHSLRKHKKFSLKSCTRFFRAEATPQDIEDAAGAIAQDAFTWQNKRKRGISTKNTTSIELGILSDFSDNKAANEDTPGGQQLTWMQEIKREQKHQGEQLTTVGTRLTKLEQGQSLIRQSVTA